MRLIVLAIAAVAIAAAGCRKTSQPPVAADDAYTTEAGVALIVAAPGVLANDVDNEANTLTAFLVDGPVHGTLTLNEDGSFRYVPRADFFGTDSFTYQASDGVSKSAATTVTLNVTAVPDPPLAPR